MKLLCALRVDLPLIDAALLRTEELSILNMDVEGELVPVGICCLHIFIEQQPPSANC